MKKLSFLFLCFVMFFAFGCKQQDINGSGTYLPGDSNDIFANEPEIRKGTQSNPNLKTIYFDFDKTEISEAAKEILKENAKYLSKHPKMNIAVEGHCDERGTIEYNLSLGQRRAMKIKEYYVYNLGITPSRIATVSYGKEKPADTSNNELAYSKNRRVETKEIKK